MPDCKEQSEDARADTFANVLRVLNEAGWTGYGSDWLCPKCGVEGKLLDADQWGEGTIHLAEPEKHGYHFHDIDGEECLKRQLATANAVIAKLPHCWRLVDGKLVQDVPITADKFQCYALEDNEAGPGKVVPDVTVRAILGKHTVRCDIGGYRILTAVLRRADKLYSTREAAAAAREKTGGMDGANHAFLKAAAKIGLEVKTHRLGEKPAAAAHEQGKD